MKLKPMDCTDPGPFGVVRVVDKHWWWCVDGDPKKALFKIGDPMSPVANRHEDIAASWNFIDPKHSAQLVYIERAYCPFFSDYSNE